MSKWLVLLIIVILGALIWFGILEVKVNIPSSTSELTNATNTLVKEKSTYEKGRAYIISLKRKSELFVVRDREKRLVLSLLYVKNDAQRLQSLIDTNAQAASLIPQAEMLVNSIEQVRSNAEKAPVEVVASLKDDSAEAFTIAREALSGLQEQYAEVEEIHDDFTRLTESLESQIGQLGLGESSSKDKSEDQSEDQPEGDQ